MGFKDIFSRRVQEQDSAAAAVREQKHQEAVVRQGVQVEVEPKIKELVNEVFQAMAAAKWPTIPVEGREADPGLRAHSLGSFTPASPEVRGEMPTL